MLRNLVAAATVINAVAQCGPDGDKAYPPGSTTCPTGSSGSGPPSSGAGCSNPSCSSPPCGISLLGDAGCTTVSGTETYKHELIAAGGTIASGAHIFGPFEAGFTSMQESIISNWGCADPSLVYDSAGGHDIGIAELSVAYKCNIEFPRIEGNTYYGAVGECGGHTSDYHFHCRFKCLYVEAGGHSTQVGEIAEKYIYGKWEDYDNDKLPYLDACGGHFGTNPDSSSEVYHYHVQDTAPFTVGCHGPNANGGLVTIGQCRALYSECGDSSQYHDIDTAAGIIPYNRYCPCYDGAGSNRGTVELASISASDNWYSASSSSSSATTIEPAAGVTPDPTVAPTTPATPTPTAPATPTPTTPATEATPAPTAAATPTPTAPATPAPTTPATPAPTTPATPAPTQVAATAITVASSTAELPSTTPAIDEPETVAGGQSLYGVCNLVLLCIGFMFQYP